MAPLPPAGRNRSGPQPARRPASASTVSELQASFTRRLPTATATAPVRRDRNPAPPVAPKSGRSPPGSGSGPGSGSAAHVSELHAILAQKKRMVEAAAPPAEHPTPPPSYWQLPAAAVPALVPVPTVPARMAATPGTIPVITATTPAPPTPPGMMTAQVPAATAFPAVHAHAHTNRGRQRRLELYNNIQDQLKQLGTSGLCAKLVADLKAALPEVVV